MLHHATQENYEMLSKRHPEVEFEKPKLEGSDLTRELLKKYDFVVCSVTDTSESRAIADKLDELNQDGEE